MMKHQLQRFLLPLTLTAVTVLASFTLKAQSLGSTKAKYNYEATESLDLEIRVDSLLRTMDDCFNYPDQERCMGFILFSLGYSFHEKAILQYSTDHDFYSQAESYYFQALELVPDNKAVIRNLTSLYKETGDISTGIEWIDRIESVANRSDNVFDKMRAALYLEFDADSAYKYHKKARSMNMYDPEAIAGLLATLDLGIEPDEYFVSLAHDLFSIGRLEDARRCFADVIHANYEKRPAIAADALIGWVEVMGAVDLLPQWALSDLPEPVEWQFPGLENVYNVTNDPFQAKRLVGWWGQEKIRSHIIATYVRKLGENFYLEGDLNSAVKIYMEAYDIGPRSRFYERRELETKYPVRHRIGIDLIQIGEDRIANGADVIGKLENDLFDDKMLEILKGNPEGMQRTHSILGLLYSEQGKWGSSMNVRSAIYQLENAIQNYNRGLEQSYTSFAPIPELHWRLAIGYETRDKPEKGTMYLIEAAMGYMDLDDLIAAEEAISKLNTYSGLLTVEQLQKVAELESWLSLRQSSETDSVYSPGQIQSVFRDPGLAGAEPHFQNRQLFKAHHGNFENALARGDSLIPIFSASYALNSMAQETQLANFKDMSRLEHICDFLGSVNGGDGAYELPAGYVPGEMNRLNIWATPQSPELQARRLGVSTDLLIFSRIIEATGVDHYDLVADRKLQVRDGIVYMSEELERHIAFESNARFGANGAVVRR